MGEHLSILVLIKHFPYDRAVQGLPCNLVLGLSFPCYVPWGEALSSLDVWAPQGCGLPGTGPCSPTLVTSEGRWGPLDVWVAGQTRSSLKRVQRCGALTGTAWVCLTLLEPGTLAWSRVTRSQVALSTRFWNQKPGLIPGSAISQLCDCVKSPSLPEPPFPHP